MLKAKGIYSISVALAVTLSSCSYSKRESHLENVVINYIHSQYQSYSFGPTCNDMFNEIHGSKQFSKAEFDKYYALWKLPKSKSVGNPEYHIAIMELSKTLSPKEIDSLYNKCLNICR